MDTKTLAAALVLALVFCGTGFWAGMTYARSARGRMMGQFTQLSSQGAARFGARPSGGAAFGTIVAKDAGSLTIQLDNPLASSTQAGGGGSKIILLGASTEVGKMIGGSQDDLRVGESVAVMGEQNSDGSISARTIQIRD